MEVMENKMKILIACEFSGVVRNAFTEHGHDVMSCDLLPSEKPGQHYQGDVFDIIDDGWDIMVAHPPCTYLANSGVCWLYKKEGRWDDMRKGADFFKSLLYADIDKICIENPIPHKYAVDVIGQKYNQIVQPYQFGHMESKATCLWLKNLSKLKSTDNVKSDMLKLPKNVSQRLHYLSPGPERQKERSRTYSGIAKAMAKQWG
jgi:hypothetical protein